MASSSNRQEAKILQRIKFSLDHGDFYEAHQRYRTLYFRLVSQNRIEDALALLYNGAVGLFEKDQVDSGTDLALLYLNVLMDHKIILTNARIREISQLHNNIREDHPDRSNFVNGAVKWSAEACKKANRDSTYNNASDAFQGINLNLSGKYGHPDVHSELAVNLWKEKNYPESRSHFLLSNNGEMFGEMLVEFQCCVGYPTEVDLFIAQAVFHLLCMQNIPEAKETLLAYTSRHPDISTALPPFKYPLLNFLYYLIQTAEKKRLPLYTVLCEQYSVVLRRDPVFFRHLDKIGQLFFGLPPRENAQRPAGLLGGLMNTIFSSMADTGENEGGDDFEDDECDEEVYEVASESLPTSAHVDPSPPTQDLD